jgi:putative DNA primase/helicase
VAPDELDADPMLLNTKSGTIDLRTGELREHRREDLITKLAPVEYDPGAEAPAWGAFLERVLPDEELRGFVRRAAGYSASGDTSEQCLFINHGVGANGKSTFHEAAAAALGDYAMRAPTDMLLARRSGAVPNDVARLKGARFVTAAETEDGRRLAESLVKDLTGQDTITARFMRAEFFDFKPTHKLHLSTNHKPEIRGTDAAIWRRIRLVPWTVTIPPAEQDKKLSEKLRGELAGVLAWIVRGCVEWRHEGLKAPDAVRKATGAYRSEMDVIGAFIEDCCVLRPDASALATPLYVAYKEWCEESGEPIEKQRRFGMRLTERGLRREKVGGVYKWYGIGLRGGGAGPSGGNGPGNEKPSFAGNSAASEDGAGPSGPENTIAAREYTSREVIANNGPNGPNGPDSLPTEEQLRRIRALVKQGFSEHSARIEVLAKDHPPGCECEVCL